MNPCAEEPEFVEVAVGSGGADEVNVVARRVGLKRLEEAYEIQNDKRLK